MENKVLKAEIRSERAVRRISASLGFIIAAVMAIMILISYLKFEPKVGDEITDGKLKQFFDIYKNRGLFETALISIFAGMTCFLPACLADISTVFVTYAAYNVVFQKMLGNITKFPNGFFLTSLVFFGISVYCAVKRNQIYNTKGRIVNINSLIPISAGVLVLGILKCKAILNFKAEYEDYKRFTDTKAEDYIPRDWGEFDSFTSKVDSCVSSDYVTISIVFIFVAVIIVLLHNFPRLALLASSGSSFYTLYRITVGNVAIMSFPIFIISVFSVVCALGAVSATRKLRNPNEYEDAELEEDAYEDDEDDAEFLEVKNSLDEKGLEMQEY